MADIFPTETRRAIMRRISGKNTQPEYAVRSLLHRLGYRFRLHRTDLPGKPDIVLPKHRTVVFVHGCFWHQHPGCPRAARPTSNVAFWDRKLSRNAERDSQKNAALEKLGWRVIVVWQCELKDLDTLASRLGDAIKDG